ncbi:MAG: (d)CMP kinase [Propionibacteriaceae bacterium]|jgi:cytidylate kinase|nr:(d)CMP kinase [Propionibacteriaceae bacterium]
MFTIAIDGPSGSGKSTAARETARRLGFGYLDTGAMYRAVALGCLRAGIAQNDRPAITAYCRGADIRLSFEPTAQRVVLAGEDVTTAIREPAVSAWVSAVATNQNCRSELVGRQQAVIAAGDFVLEGRDTTTVIAPTAQVRLLLLADPRARLARRGAELGGAVDREQLTDQVLRRDHDDATMVDFERPAIGVHVIDSTDLAPEEVVRRILALAQAAGLDRSGRAVLAAEPA